MLKFVATWLLIAFGSYSAFAVEDRPPNIVLIMADDLGYGGLGCYGQTKVTTPNIDQLAANGVRFTQAYTGCCMRAPSRCCLLTGLHTGHARVRANDHKAGRRVTYAPDVIHDAAIEFIRENKSRPFFCYLATTIPHAEMLVPEDSLKQYQDQFPETPYVGDRYASNERPRATYAAMVSRMDRDVGRLVRLVQQLSIEQDTLILFTSDNGPINAGGADPAFFNNGGNLRGWKFSLYEGGIRVPLIATWPGHIAPKASSEMPLSHDDVFPTFCEMVNVPVPIGLDGVSVLPTLLGKPNPNIKKKLY